MALRRLPYPHLIAAAIAFLVALAVFQSLNRSPAPAPSPAGDAAAASASTAERIGGLQEAVRAGDASPRTYARLGDAYLQRSRETGDPAYYGRAERAFDEALAHDPRSVDGLIGKGTVALSRHDFRAALRHGEQALTVAPDLVRSYTVIVDAQVELGRYDDARRSLQRMVDLKPNLASYARVSYFRELHGDLAGAAEAMRLAVSAGGEAAENVAYVQSLLGTLELDRGRLGAAARAYTEALARVPGYAPAEAGSARIAAARGDLGEAIDRYRDLVTRLPLPEYVIALGEAELAAGREAAARRDFELVAAEQRLLEANGVNTDVELALFEADHGDARRGLGLARRAFAAAPSVRSEDALGWALTRSGRPQEGLARARRALRLGSRDPVFLYHAGMSARAAGEDELARRYLARALDVNPRFSPLHAPRAERALDGLR